jgi:hypothetical protein
MGFESIYDSNVVSTIGSQAWIFLTKSEEERSWSANRGYDDVVGIYYSYDSNVPNSRQVAAGDVVVIRVDDWVAGWGVIEFIEVTPNVMKEVRRCPNCRKTNHRPRTRPYPSNICDACKAVFSDEQVVTTFEPVTGFKAFYANTWIEAARPVDFRELALIQKSKGTFNAIRPINSDLLGAFLQRVSGRDVDIEMEVSYKEVNSILGGHTEAVVRRRRGQRAFRFEMIKRYGERCAFSGVQPPQVLEAAHLYSFASRPVHRSDGGLLLRRDYHSLFDAKLIAINPANLKVEIAPRLYDYSSYRGLDGVTLQFDSDKRPSLDLLADHYDQAIRVFALN